jgi:hypothetical protein
MANDESRERDPAEVERRFRGLMDDAGLPAPDEVEHRQDQVRFLWNDHKVAVVVDLAEDES